MIRTVSLVMVMAMPCALACAQDRLSVSPMPGLWKVLTKTSQDGKPMADKSENHCYSAAEFADLVGTFATLFANQQCSRTHAISGNTLTLGATCSGPAPQGTLTVKGEGSYVFEDEKHFTGSLVSTFALPNQPSTSFSVSKIAEYVGPCPE